MAEDIDLPLGLDLELWDEFLEFRKKRKCPNTPRAVRALIKKLEQFFALGYNINQIVETSLIRGWVDVYQPKTAPLNSGVNVANLYGFPWGEQQ